MLEILALLLQIFVLLFRNNSTALKFINHRNISMCIIIIRILLFCFGRSPIVNDNEVNDSENEFQDDEVYNNLSYSRLL